MIKLGTTVTDTSTGQKGTLIVLQLETGGNRFYCLQPHGCNPKDGLPLVSRWITEDFISGGIVIEEPEIPEGILGSWAQDIASGFEGTVVSIRLHLNGCFHASLQSDKILKETNTVPDTVDFDIRRLKGDKVPVFATDKDLEKDKKNKPSPENVKPYSPRI